uniref:Cdc6 C-terminal domain-containing protein n=1 Tax=Brassica oleracea var. oleracea TaxID=109376 RepID=A0A0D3C891_BRAOL
MPTIAGPGSSSYNHIVAAGSEKSESIETPQKRKLRSEEANLLSEDTISTPKKLKSRIPISERQRRSYVNHVRWVYIDEEQMRAVKEALHVSKAPSTIVCREDEQRRVFEFVKGCLDQQKAGSLYICGCPGTGKSLSMEKTERLNEFDQAGLPPVDGHIVCELHFTDKDNRYIQQGVANAIDLADRFLPKLKSLNCEKVSTLKVLPYVAFQSNALELCARKVGDMRKALSVCRSAIEIIEIDIRGSPGPESQGPTPDNPVVRMDNISKTFKSPVVDTIQTLPQHQQIIICSAAKAFRGSKKDATIGELNKLYLEICKSRVISPAGITEFTNMCTVLNDQGILKFGQARGHKLKRVSLRVDESDITFALQDIFLGVKCTLGVHFLSSHCGRERLTKA